MTIHKFYEKNPDPRNDNYLVECDKLRLQGLTPPSNGTRFGLAPPNQATILDPRDEAFPLARDFIMADAHRPPGHLVLDLTFSGAIRVTEMVDLLQKTGWKVTELAPLPITEAGCRWSGLTVREMVFFSAARIPFRLPTDPHPLYQLRQLETIPARLNLDTASVMSFFEGIIARSREAVTKNAVLIPYSFLLGAIEAATALWQRHQLAALGLVEAASQSEVIVIGNARTLQTALSITKPSELRLASSLVSYGPIPDAIEDPHALPRPTRDESETAGILYHDSELATLSDALAAQVVAGTLEEDLMRDALAERRRINELISKALGLQKTA